MSKVIRFKDKDVAAVFESYPPKYRNQLLELRDLIFKAANEIAEIDEIIETLKWGEPSYLPKKKKVGTTIRIHWLKSKPDQIGIYFNCQTNMITKIKRRYGSMFRYEGKRGLIFLDNEVIPLEEVESCITMALTYYLSK